MKVIAAYDAEPCSRLALEQLADAALPDHAEIIVVSFADLLLPPGSAIGDMALGIGLPEPVIDMHRAAKALADIATERAEAGAAIVRSLGKPWAVSSRSIADTPSWGLVQLAEDEKADLIITGSHNRSGVARFFLGSVAQKAIQEAPCSVRIVRPLPSPASHRVLIGVDGSAACTAAIKAIAERPWPADTEFSCITVIDSQFISASLWQTFTGTPILAESVRHESEAARAVLDDATAILAARGFSAATIIAHGDPREIIPQHAEDLGVSCLMIAARGRHHAERRHLGTVAAAIPTRAHCTVEVVRA